MSRTQAQHNAHIEARDRTCEAGELAAYHVWMSAMAELDRAGRLDRAGPTAVAAYRDNLACLRAKAEQ